MPEASAIAAAIRVAGIDQAIYVPAGAVVRSHDIAHKLGSSGRELWQRAAWLHPWQVVVELGSGLGEMVVGVPLPPASRLVAVESRSPELPYLQRSLSEFDRAVDLIESEFSPDSPEFTGLAQLASQASTPDSVQNVCFRMGWPIDADKAMVELDDVLSRFTRWAVVVRLTGLDPQRITEFARGRFIFLMDTRTKNFVRIGSGRSEAAVSRLLESGWLYADEAVVLSSAELAGTW